MHGCHSAACFGWSSLGQVCLPHTHIVSRATFERAQPNMCQQLLRADLLPLPCCVPLAAAQELTSQGLADAAAQFTSLSVSCWECGGQAVLI
jgi:hypothetical protein